jgi:hypothetical protein
LGVGRRGSGIDPGAGDRLDSFGVKGEKLGKSLGVGRAHWLTDECLHPYGRLMKQLARNAADGLLKVGAYLRVEVGQACGQPFQL